MTKRTACRQRCGKGGPQDDGYFKSPYGEKVHYLRAHTAQGKTWAKGPKAEVLKKSEGPKAEVLKKSELAATPKIRLIDRVKEILKQQPQGMHLTSITNKLQEQGVTSGAKGIHGQIATMVARYPNVGIVRVSRSVYGLAVEDEQTPGMELSVEAQIVLLQHENHRQREVLLRTIQAMGEIALLATSPIDIEELSSCHE